MRKAWTYAQATASLDALAQTKGMVFGLENIRKLDQLLGNPSQSLQSVHIAGTNGKGSVAGKIAYCLQAAGYRTGLYTSPHVLEYRERLQVDGENVGKLEFAGMVEEGFGLKEVNKLKCTAFDLLTGMSFAYFHRKSVDFAVIEVGLGGSLDSTNIITPEVSVITSIGFDHISLLGSSLTDIAREKAGIMKPGRPVVLGPNVPVSLLKEIAGKVGAPCINVPAAGDFESADQENTRIAQAALTLLMHKYPKLTPSHVNLAGEFQPLGRKQAVIYDNNSKVVVIDTGHNVSALSRLFYDLIHLYPAHRFQAIMAISADKQVNLCIEEVMKHVEKVHFVSNGYHRLLSYQQMREIGLSIDPMVVGYSGIPSEVLPNALSSLQKDEIMVICGSFFIMPDIYSTLKLPISPINQS